MKRITSGISQTGGKYRSVNRLKNLTPYHEFFLSMFTGAAHFELNKPRCRYECFNDAESDIINYLVQIHEHPKEFDVMKQGVFGLVSQEICNRIVNGKITPKNDLEKAYYFYYLNKLTFGGSIWKVRKKPPYQGVAIGNTSKLADDAKEVFELKTKGYAGLNQNRAIPQSTFHKEDIEKIKEGFEIKTKGFVGLLRNGILPDVSDKSVKEAKAKFRGMTLPTVCKEKSVDDAKANFRGVVPKANYAGIVNSGQGASSSWIVEKARESFKERQSAYKGTNPKTTRPYTNNDCGLLSPINPEAIKRLRYVNLTAYDFRKVYKMFYEAFHVRKGLERECFIYADPPYPGTEKYYGDLFSKDDHQDLIDILLETPFNFMLSIGGVCKEIYIEPLMDAGWNIVPVKVRYSTSATTQKESQEYICMNYEIKGIAKMIQDSSQKIMNEYF